MGWFDKENSRIPELPELPRLPEAKIEPPKKSEREKLPQLPTIPSSELGEKFSQNMIKEAVSGKEEDDEEGITQINPPHLKKMMLEEITPERNLLKIKKEIPENFREVRRVKEEPIFIRIDKFEESLKLFEKTRERISQVEKFLRDIKKIKAEEEKELSIWEEELQNLKNQIEKINEDIFSKIE